MIHEEICTYEVNEVTMADGSKWLINDCDINEMIKRVKEL